MDPGFYAIRWLTTLLSREFLLPDTIRLWDSMFASTHKENFLRYVCGTMVMMVRDELIKGDFSTCLRLLQSYPPTNVDSILQASRNLWIYESQITLACHRGGITLHQALHAIHPPDGIIMAFGLRGGVAPTLSDQIHDAATVVEQTTTGLLGRAKQLWKLKTTTSVDSESTAPPNVTDGTLTSHVATDLPSGDTGEVTIDDQEEEEEDIPPVGEETAAAKARRLWKGLQSVDVPDIPITSHNEENKVNAPPAPPSTVPATMDERVTAKVGRLWRAWTAPTPSSAAEGRGGATATISNETLSPPSLSLPNKPRAWNRGRTESYGKSSERKARESRLIR
jgi:hypothetical protein